MAKGIIKRYDFRKGFGFIAENDTDEDFFFHKSEWQGDGPIRQGLAVKFIGKDSEKGPQAEAVIPLDGESKKPSNGKKTSSNSKPSISRKPEVKAAPVKSASLEDRIALLERSVTTLKVVSFLALAGVVALVVERLLVL